MNLKSGIDVIDIEIKSLQLLKKNLSKSFSDTVELLFKTKGKIIVSGIGKSGHVASKISSTLSSIGSPSFFIHPSEANHGDLGMITKNDSVILISNSGEQLGIKSIDDALSIASKENLDLVQLNDDKDTPVCKLMNYGKHLFDKKKQKSASKKKQKKTQIKEVKFRPGTEENDYQIKLKKIIKFLDEGDKAKITMRFRGREMAHQNIGFDLLKRVEEDLDGRGSVEQAPLSEGRQLVMLLSPAKTK